MSLLSEAPAQFTGTGRYVSELLGQLGKRPGEVSVNLLVEPSAANRAAGIATSNVSVHAAKGYRAGKSRVSRLAALTAVAASPRPLARQFAEGADVVHYPLTLKVPAAPVPSVLSYFDVQHHDLPQHFTRAQHLWRRVMYDDAARRATKVVTISEHARTRIIESVNIEPERIVAVHLGVDHQHFAPRPAADDERLLAGLGLPRRFVFYPASLWPHKNHLMLLEALASVDDDELGLVLSGARFGKLGSLMAAAERQGLTGRVQHLGHVPEEALPALYRRAAALVFPSLHEGFGIPPVEAMACGCPVASSKAAALAEVCGSAVSELDPQSSEQMARTIELVVHDEVTRARLRAAGFRQASLFSWVRNAEAHLAVYRAAVEDGGR